jgi:hypothetical protein
MPKIVVEGPDGRKFAFPDTMPRAEINAFMKQKYGTKARDESVQDYLARFGREQAATEARVKDIDREATAVGRAEGERAAERMGVDNPFLMAFAAPAIGLAQQEGGRQVFNREGTVLADEAAGLAAANSAGFFVPGLVNPQFGARVEEGRRQQPLAAFAGDIAGGYGPGEIIGAGVAKAAQAIGPGMAAVGRMFSRGPGPNATNAIAGGTLGGIAPAETAEERARNIALGVGLGAVARPASQMVDDLTRTGAPRAMPDAMPAGAGDNPYFGRQSMRPPGSGPSPREIETQQQWATATPIVTQARTTAQSAQQAADAALQSKAPADIARAKDQKKTLVGQLQEAQASRAGMDTPEDARLAETLASLTENTSDPVLLSTQISAAKTSLDRLLTDIGSPVEGNLIPVKTNILTRTQAPRSAAEGPQDRASVTRYAEGEAPPIKGMGFGASTPKTSEQAVRFETPGSPEYEAAVAKGLDMSQAGRMGRRKSWQDAAGTDPEIADTVLYHGTASDVLSFDPAKAGSATRARSAKMGTWLTGDPRTAEGYAEVASETPVRDLLEAAERAERNREWDVAEKLTRQAEELEAAGGRGQTIMPLYVRGKLKTIDMDGVQYDPDDVKLSKIAQAAKQEGFDGIRLTNFSDEAGYGNYNPTTHVLIFDPSNIRSVNAAFDPEKSGSSTLLAAAPFAAVSGAGLTSERELGSKMTREKKD